MKIMNSSHKQSPSFTSTRLSGIINTANDCSTIHACHYTNLARKDYNWEKLPALLYDRFEKQGMTNINFYGGSDGSDAYTFVINAIRTLGAKAKKFFPVLSSDLSPSIIKEADESKIFLHNRDIEYLKNLDALKYFEKNNQEDVQIMSGIEFFPYKVKPELRDKVEFSVQDIRKAVMQKDFADSALFFRNGWGFNKLDEQNNIAKDLYEHSNAKTIIGIGQSDLYKSDASDSLQRNGFKGIKTEVFTNAETDYPAVYAGTPKTKPVYEQFVFFEK
ncbi:unknown [Clostridium sp. CAG:967]|nr:unknown [Clostridium sp. CAG:967]